MKVTGIQDAPDRGRLIHREGGDGRGHSRAWRVGNQVLGAVDHPGGRAPFGACRWGGPVLDGTALAAHVQGLVLPGRRRLLLRHQRHRHRPVGHQGQGAGDAGLQAARRAGQGQGGLLPALPGAEYRRAGRELHEQGGRGLEVRAVGPARDIRQGSRRRARLPWSPSSRCGWR